jgi:hypothetical protein
MSKLIDKIKSILSGSSEVAAAKDAVVKAAKVVAEEVVAEVKKAPAKKAPAKKAVAKKVGPRPEDAARASETKIKKTK